MEFPTGPLLSAGQVSTTHWQGTKEEIRCEKEMKERKERKRKKKKERERKKRKKKKEREIKRKKEERLTNTRIDGGLPSSSSITISGWGTASREGVASPTASCGSSQGKGLGKVRASITHSWAIGHYLLSFFFFGLVLVLFFCFFWCMKADLRSQGVEILANLPSVPRYL